MDHSIFPAIEWPNLGLDSQVHLDLGVITVVLLRNNFTTFLSLETFFNSLKIHSGSSKLGTRVIEINGS